MASKADEQLQLTVRRQAPFRKSVVNYLVMRDVLSIQVNPLGRPMLVMIPAKSVVELVSKPSADGLLEVTWQHRAHMIFAADLTRLRPD